MDPKAQRVMENEIKTPKKKSSLKGLRKTRKTEEQLLILECEFKRS